MRPGGAGRTTRRPVWSVTVSAPAGRREQGERQRQRGQEPVHGAPGPSARSVTPADLNVAMSVSIDDRGAGEADAERRAGPLPEPHSEIEVRLETERLEHPGVPGLRRAMGGEQAAARGRLEPDRDQRRRARDEAVQDHREAVRGAGQDDADETGDLEAADLGERVERVARDPARSRSRARRIASTLRRRPAASTPVPGPVTLSAVAPVSAATSALAAVVLPIPISPVPTRSAPAARSASTSPMPASIACTRLRARHRGPARHVRRARRDPEVAQSGMPGQRGRHAQVRHHHARARVAREHVDRGSAPEEILDHLRGDDLRIGAHALGDHAVIAREREDDRIAERRRAGPGDGRPGAPPAPRGARGCREASSADRAGGAPRPRRRDPAGSRGYGAS